MKNSTRFSSIFSDIKHRGKRLFIGDYQRPISWGKTETLYFVKDAEKSITYDDNNYGAIYLFERNKNKTDVVEGQQRFVAYVAVLSAIRNFIINKKLNSKNEDLDIIAKDIREILCTQSGFSLLQTTGQDDIDLESIIDNDEEHIKKDENKKHKLISNYNNIYLFIKNLFKDKGAEGIKEYYYDGINKASMLLDYCQSEEEVVFLFQRLNRETVSPTQGNLAYTNLYAAVNRDIDCSEEEKEKLIEKLQPVRFYGKIDSFFANYIYFKTGIRPSLKDLVAPFNQILKEQKNIKDFVNEILFIYKLQEEIFHCNIHSSKYTEYEINKLNSILKIFCNPYTSEDIVPLIIDLLTYPEKAICINDIIDIVQMMYFTHLRAAIIGYSSHVHDGFASKYNILREVINNKNENNTYQEILFNYLEKTQASYLKQYSNKEIIDKINNDFNLAKSTFRDSLLNIINNYNNKGELQDLFDDCNIVQREHIKCKNEFDKSNYIKDMAGNVTVIIARDNMSNGSKPFIEKIDTFKNSNFIINKNIAESSKWELEEIKNETNRRAKIIAEFTNPVRFCKTCSDINETIETVEKASTTEVVYA